MQKCTILQLQTETYSTKRVKNSQYELNAVVAKDHQERNSRRPNQSPLSLP